VGAEMVSQGGGSYTTVRPADCKPLPEEIHRSDRVTGPVPTSQWWSSLLWQPFSQPMFAHPLAMRCDPAGLAIGYPGAAIVAGADAIMGGGLGESGDIRIGHSACGAFPAALCDGFSEWFVKVRFAEGGAVLETAFGHGSPYVFCEVEGGSVVLRMAEAPRLWHGGRDSAHLGVTVRGNHYGLFGAAGTVWQGLEGKEWRAESSGAGHFTLALLPDDREETFALFARHAHNHVTSTRAVARVENGQVLTEYHFQTRALEPGAEGTLFALYPHQWKYTEHALLEQRYASVRGVMKLGAGGSFRTRVPVQGVLPHLPAEGIPDRAAMLGHLQAEVKAMARPIADTYWEGKHLGKLATLAGIAEAAGDETLRRAFLGEIRRRLEDWFTASPGESTALFYYNARWGSLIGSKPSYGSDMPLNDHHFHYGYFIRAAAEVARQDPEWARRWGPMVKLLIRDIASTADADPMFPRLRCFDVYAGHSWASGDANFADGNNLESSSEALNAWYGLILWGEVTGDAALRDTGLRLFNTERTAVEEYWFDVSGEHFPPAFPEEALGMVWGGKGAFATWFSADVDCIHGINWLPFTPASLYLGRHPDYVRRSHARLLEKRPGGTDFNTGWGDLVVLFGALADPGAAEEILARHPRLKLEGGNTRAFSEHWVGTLARLGTPDAGVTADQPFFGVFRKDGRRSYVVANPGKSPRSVRFSDGTQVQAAPGRITLHQP
jgi:endoglucanase Acf2